jgi:hypothetical protein
MDLSVCARFVALPFRKGCGMRTNEVRERLRFKVDREWQQYTIPQLLKRVGWATLCLAFLAVLVSPAVAQSTSSLNGRVSDSSGAAVPGASITLTAAATGLKRTATSNVEGAYQFLAVPPGNYRLEAKAQGFSSYVVPQVTLLVSTASTVNIQLQLARVVTTVTVKGTAVPLVNTTDASLGTAIEESQIEQLPIADRDVGHLLSLQSGVTYLGWTAPASMT